MLVLSLFLLVVLANNAAYGQQTSPSEQRMLTRSSFTPLKPYIVKITSPTKGQQVPVGKNLTISGITGTAAGNITMSHCQVSVIANGIKPYQPAKGSGPGGAADYSKWNFVLSSKYSTIKQGPNNKITAKYPCSNNPAISSFYSVNVTGVLSVTDQHNQPIRTINSTAINNRGTGVVATPKVEYPPTNSTVIATATSPISDSRKLAHIDSGNLNGQGNNNISTGPHHVSQIGSNVSTLPNQSPTNYHNSGSHHQQGNNSSKGNHSANHSLNNTINELKNRIINNVKKQLEGSGIRVPLPIS